MVKGRSNAYDTRPEEIAMIKSDAENEAKY